MDGRDNFGVTDASENEERGPVSYWGPGGEEGVEERLKGTAKQTPPQVAF